MSEEPRDYDREYTRRISPDTRVRMGYDHERGQVTRFVHQLEYRIDVDEDAWRVVVRYDHDSLGSEEATHDVTEEGLHIDIYRDGEVYRTEYVAPPMPAGKGLDRAEDHLAQNLEQFVTRFEEWHEIRRP